MLRASIAQGNGKASGNGNGIPGEDTPAPDLTRADVVRILAAFPAEGKDGPRFAGANLAGLDLSGLNLNYADFKRANLRGANLQRCELFGADFADADLSDADLSGAEGEDGIAGVSAPTFTRANLTRCKLAGAGLNGANFEAAKARNADFTGALMDGASFLGADTTGAIGISPAKDAKRKAQPSADDDLTAQADGLHPDFTKGTQEDADGDCCSIDIPREYLAPIARAGMPAQWMADGSGEQGIITHCLPDVAVVKSSTGKVRALPWSGVELIMPEPDPLELLMPTSRTR